MITLTVGGVAVSHVLIDSGATCNMMGQQTWEMLKLKGIKCESRKSARQLFSYSGTEPLPTLGTFTADVMLTGNSNGCRADFVVVKDDGRTLLGGETAELLNLLFIGPFQANNVDSGETGSQMQTASLVLNQQTVRRSSLVVKKPLCFRDFVLSLRS